MAKETEALLAKEDALTGAAAKKTGINLQALLQSALPKTKMTFKFVGQIRKVKEIGSDVEVNAYTLELSSPVSCKSSMMDTETGINYFVDNTTEATVRESVLEVMTNSGNVTMNDDGTVTYEGPEVFFDVTRAGKVWTPEASWQIMPPRLIVTDISMADLSRRARDAGRDRAKAERKEAMRKFFNVPNVEETK